jgi:hypothetical protein
MQLNLLSIIGIGLAAMFFGYGFGLFEGRGQGYKKRKKEETEEKKIQPPVIAPLKENNLLRLIMDNGNQLRLEVDGQSADAAQLAPEQRKRIIDLLMKLRPWIDASAAKSAVHPQPVSPRPIHSAPIAASHSGTGPISQHISKPKAPAADRMPPLPKRKHASATAQTVKVEEPKKKAEATPVPQPISKPIAPVPASKPVRSRVEVPSKKGEAVPSTMVGQIDAILQAHLSSLPLENRVIRLIESPEGDVAVMVGLTKYNGVGEVPDPQVQDIIRAAIAEWEDKYTPGI